MELLNKYNFGIKHIKGKENRVVVAPLSRRVHEMHVVAISMCNIDLKGTILEAVTVDPHYV